MRGSRSVYTSIPDYKAGGQIYHWVFCAYGVHSNCNTILYALLFTFPSEYQLSHWHRFKESEQCSGEIPAPSDIHSSSDWQEFTGPVEDPGHLDQRAHDDLSLY